MTKSTITREQLLEIIETDHVQCGEASYLARMALAAMDSEPVELPLDYLQGHKDGLEWAAQLAESNHPETGDWLYDDPIELAKAIRKGPDMPPAQPAPVVSAELLHTAASAIEDLLTTKDRTGACVWFDLPFRLRSAANAHSAPVVPDDVLAALQKVARIRLDLNDFDGDRRGIADCLCDAEEVLIEVVNRRAAMLAAAPQSPGSEPATVPGKWIPVSERLPDCWCLTCRPVVLNDMRFVLCPDCGNKRCPRANDHRNACTGSNEPGQEGGAYPDTPQEVKP
ncbi:hypothetical protein CKQ90_00220 [Klebsiella pneumoniae]|nr:DUF551 domain-containing protein [Klebsiella pneumoniae]PHQ09042.1 hypothetical protein CKQ87_25805 [Klebsiella pneumoniae]PIN66392.1 hypothetical protein CKQ90_00220 [Klebsiella pneumoniae]HBZ2112904.1 DUF551 domain-containing protein [Klebsiella pneumoniae]